MLYEFPENLGAIAILQNNLRLLVERSLKGKSRLTNRDFLVLHAAANGGDTIKDIRLRLGLTFSEATLAVKRLSRQGFVDCSRSQTGDNLLVHVAVTPLGQIQYEAVMVSLPLALETECRPPLETATPMRTAAAKPQGKQA